ncbi:hypothetical protein H0H92_001938 [Tricholoma furcatifolium]|nr:hypothetical protein H0H92_001938 [Tricholoma furcatifolium]
MAEVARPALHLTAAIAGGIPGVGAPIKVAIDSLLIILDGLAQKGQNKADIRDLRVRMQRILSIIDAGAGDNPRADNFVKQLADTEKRLWEAQKISRSFFKTQKVSRVVKSCVNDVNNYMNEYQLAMMTDFHARLRQQEAVKARSWLVRLRARLRLKVRVK